jgi:hypothetical protein
MKIQRTISTLSLGLALGLLTTASVASADETVTTTKSTTYSGVVSEMNPSSSTIILRSQSSAAPVTYTYSKETTFVDSAGNPVSSSALVNSPVTVEYSNEGGRTVVRRVIQTGPASVHEKTTTERRVD